MTSTLVAFLPFCFVWLFFEKAIYPFQPTFNSVNMYEQILSPLINETYSLDKLRH